MQAAVAHVLSFLVQIQCRRYLPPPGHGSGGITEPFLSQVEMK